MSIESLRKSTESPVISVPVDSIKKSQESLIETIKAESTKQVNTITEQLLQKSISSEKVSKSTSQKNQRFKISN